MNSTQKAMHRMAVEAAALMPSLQDGESVKDPVWAVRPRKDGNWRAYKDGAYWGTTGCKDESDAQEWLRLVRLQQEAERDGAFDVRRIPVVEVIEGRKKAVDRQRLKGAAVIKSSLKALEPYVKDLQLRHLDDAKIEAIGTAMVHAGYVYEYFVNGVRYLATAIRLHTKKASGGVTYLPYDAPPRPTGRQIVVSDAERDRVKRWRGCTEDYDPETGCWSAAGELTLTQRRDRELLFRECFLGMTFGSRPGCYERLAWAPGLGGGWIDLENRVLHRIPPGSQTAANKQAPSVDIDPGVLPELYRWRAMDGDSPWLFPSLRGGPLMQKAQAAIFKAEMEKLGIRKVTGHVLRHTCITAMLTAGAPLQAVAAVCGVSVKFLLGRYAHLCQFAVQKLAHGVTAGLMG
jgi:integrase